MWTNRRGIAALRLSWLGRPDGRGPAPVVADAAEPPAAAPAPAAPVQLGVADLQVLTHTVIGDLFAAGLHVQAVARTAPAELQDELMEVGDQIDTAIQEIRSWAFRPPPPPGQ